MLIAALRSVATYVVVSLYVLIVAPPGMLIAQSLRSSGGSLIVDGTVFDAGQTARVRWSSAANADWERLPS